MKWFYHAVWILTFFSSFFHAQIKVACIGDSVTRGMGIPDEKQSYPSQLQDLLGSQYIVGNFGNSGATLLSKGHKPYIKTEDYKKALDFRPDIIVVALGLNDTDPRNWPNYNNDFIGDYTAIIQSFKNINPNVKVYICRMTPIFSGHSRFLSGTREWFNQIQNLIPNIASVNNATLIDNYLPLANRIDLFADFLHPNAQGASIMANNVYHYLVPIQQKLSLNETFGDHMVLQRNVENKIKGKANANAEIKLTFNRKNYSTKTSSLGDWEITLPSTKEGGPYQLNVTSGKEEIIVNDILFGDVYLSSGQSNMAWMLKNSNNVQELIKNASAKKNIRLFKNTSLAETNDIAWDSLTLKKVNDLEFFSGKWTLSTPQNASEFSAIAYVFAEELAHSQNIPIGIIDISVGGSNTESWIPFKTLENDNLLSPYIHQWKTSDFVQDFCRKRGAKNIEKSTVKNQRHPYAPGYNYEAGIQKWINTNLTGILWYQGESNAHNIEHHAYLFEKLVHSWRENFKQKLPFYTVQLSSINRPSWPQFRDSQRILSNELENVYMAVSSDAGNLTDVHPRDKIIVGERLANLAKKHQYHQKNNADSPQPINVEKTKNSVTITFSNCDILKTKNNDLIKGFQLLTKSGHIIDLEKVTLRKNKIIIEHNSNEIKSIQYAYQAFTDANLYNEDNVPVSTFNYNLK